MHEILIGCLLATLIMAIVTAILYKRTQRAIAHKGAWFFGTLLSGAFCFFCASSSALIFVASLP